MKRIKNRCFKCRNFRKTDYWCKYFKAYIHQSAFKDFDKYCEGFKRRYK